MLSRGALHRFVDCFFKISVMSVLSPSSKHRRCSFSQACNSFRGFGIRCLSGVGCRMLNVNLFAPNSCAIIGRFSEESRVNALNTACTLKGMVL